jgi:hypothetical protein
MKRFIVLLLLLSTPAYADQAITVHTGDVVTKQFDQGTLLDAPKATKIEDQLIDGDTAKKENASFQKSIELYKANESLYQDENTLLLNRNIELSKALNDSRSTSDWLKVGYFILGAAVVSAGVYGASHLVK